MKKIISVFLAALLLFSLAGCNNTIDKIDNDIQGVWATTGSDTLLMFYFEEGEFLAEYYIANTGKLLSEMQGHYTITENEIILKTSSNESSLDYEYSENKLELHVGKFSLEKISRANDTTGVYAHYSDKLNS